MIVGMVATMFIFSSAFVVLLIVTARRLKVRKRRGLCILGAVLCSLYLPLGFILGIYMIVVLKRESVKQMFADSSTTDMTS